MRNLLSSRFRIILQLRKLAQQEEQRKLEMKRALEESLNANSIDKNDDIPKMRKQENYQKKQDLSYNPVSCNFNSLRCILRGH